MQHIESREIRYWTSAKWICNGGLHEHLSRAAAEKCERNPNARSTQRGRKGRKRDGSF